MTALIVIGSIVAFFVLLFSFSVTLYVSLTEDLRLKVGMFGLRFDVMSPEKDLKDAAKAADRLAKKEPSAKRKKKKKAKKAKKSEEKSSLKKAHTFPDTVEMIFGLIRSIFSPVTFILRHIRITHLSIRMSIGREDADQTALTFAGIGIAVNQTIALLKSQICVKIKQVWISPDFVSGETTQDISFRVKLRLGIIIAGLLGMLFHIIKNIVQARLKEQKNDEIKKEGVDYERSSNSGINGNNHAENSGNG